MSNADSPSISGAFFLRSFIISWVGFHDEPLGLEVVLHAGSLFAQLPSGLVDVQVQVSIFFEVGAGAIGAVEEAVDDGRLVTEGGLEPVVVSFQLKGLLVDIIVGRALGIEPEVGFHVLEAEKLVLPELRVQLERNDIRAFNVQVKRIAKVKDKLAADMHCPKKIGRPCQAVAGDLPQKGGILFRGWLLGL